MHTIQGCSLQYNRVSVVAILALRLYDSNIGILVCSCIAGDTADDTPAAQGLRHSISFSAPDNIGSVKDEHSIIEQYETVDCSSSVSSRSELMETDPYDEIDTGSNPCVTSMYDTMGYVILLELR